MENISTAIKENRSYQSGGEELDKAVCSEYDDNFMLWSAEEFENYFLHNIRPPRK